jgi:hypothetical protein
MKNFSFVAVLFCFFLSSSSQTFAQNTQADIRSRISNADFLLSNSSQGKEFWLAVPLNEGKTQPTLNLEFYVTSQYNTTVTLEVPGAGFILTKKIKALEVVTFTTKNASANFDWEVISSQTPDNKGIHIFSDKPISVYMLNGKEVTSDGYMGMPINSWGTDYIHCAYYDFNEYRPLGAGFIVIASEDKTTVTINLRGRGKAFAKTRSGSRIGEVLTLTLDRGQVYNVVGDATTVGTFDLTGSLIHADKPIGVISYHERTLLPQNSQNGRDHLVEMLRPTSQWGKKHVNLEFIRDNKGDFYRIVAAQNNTKWSLKYYDKMTDTLLGQRSGILNQGEFFEDYNNWAGRGAIAGIRGVTVWESDKPTMVMHYQYSANWDRGDNFDPDMVLVTPVEQFMRSTLFQTPSNPAFINNWYNYIVEGDSTDTNNVKLKSFVIDGDTVYKSYPQLFLNQVPGTNYYWGFKFMSPGPHVVTSTSKFGGYVYGFGSFNGYSWPAGSATRTLEAVDTLPPVLSYDTECGDYQFKATELRSYSSTPDTVQFDQGIYDIGLVDSISTNYRLTLLTSPTITPLPRITEFKFDLSVIDKTKPAFAILYVVDRAGNYILDTMSYTPVTLRLETPVIQFGTIRVGTTKQLTIPILNPNANPLVIKEVRLLLNQAYTIVSGNIPKQFTIPANGSYNLVISCKPAKVGLNDVDDNQLEIDSLLMMTTCATISYPLKSRGVAACANVESKWIAPTTVIGDTVYRESTGLGLLIRNTGTDTLTVSGVSGVRAPFFIRNVTPAFPFRVPPGSDVFFSSIGFAPQKSTADTVTAHFLTDGESQNCNSASTWIGKGTPVSVDEPHLPTDWGISASGKTIVATCECMDAQAATLTVYDNLGRVVGVTSSRNFGSRLSLVSEQLGTGVYLARLSVGAKAMTSVVIIP